MPGAHVTGYDPGPFIDTLKDLASISGRDFEEVLLPQIGALLKACIKRTPARSRGAIKEYASKHAGHIAFADGTVISHWKKANHAVMFLDTSNFDPRRNPRTGAPRAIGGRTWHQMDDPKRHWNADRWARFQSHMAEAPRVVARQLKDKLDARGMAKKTWWQIGEDLGLDPSIAAAYVRKAHAPGSREYKEGFAKRLLDSVSLVIEMTNSNRLVAGKLNGRAILAGAMRDRVKAYHDDLRRGVFDDSVRRATRYPGVFIS